MQLASGAWHKLLYSSLQYARMYECTAGAAPLGARRSQLHGVSISYRRGYTLCIPAHGTPVHYNLNVTHSLKTAYFPEFCSPSLLGTMVQVTQCTN